MKSVESSQQYLLLLNLWIVDVDACTFLQQILRNSDASRLPVVTNATNSSSLISTVRVTGCKSSH